MADKIKAWLSDIRSAIQEINSFLPVTKNFLEFSKDLKTKRAVERNIEIIGEAVNRILVENKDFPITNARKIIDTRNRIIHGYDTISDDILWSIIIRDLPLLDAEIERLL
jgi:uncharacterized protein with HEPN domain